MSVSRFDWLAHHAGLTPDKLALVDLASGRHLSYADLNRRAGRLARHLEGACAIGKGDRVAVLGLNSSDLFEIQFACAKLGAIFVPLNWRLAVAELEYIMGNAEPKVLVHDREFTDSARRLSRGAGAIETTGLGRPSAYEDAIAGAAGERAAQPVCHDDVWTLIYTSGTTGRPKGAMLTHGMVFYNAINSITSVRLTSRSVYLNVLPLFHTSGLNIFSNPVFHLGGTVLLARAFEPGEVLRLINDDTYGITHFLGVPAMLLFMSQHPDFVRTDFSRLEHVSTGGAPMPVPLLSTYAERGLTVLQAYGMTEVGPWVLSQTAATAHAKPGSVGKPVLHMAARIVDKESRDVAPGEIGELWFKGPNVVPGYWRNEEATRASFTDGWLHTGDAARVDADGDYYLVDRWKDMYISGGENVYPVEVENVIAAHPAVFEVAVIGLPDARWGEVGHAVVGLKQGQSASSEEIIAFCRERLARYKVPKTVEFIPGNLPRTASGKLLKRQLRDERIPKAEPSTAP